ncbi:unnamed protein product [Cyclocybe aegerita]|uniref:Uncharacterized protein n=1 Tax=Cyclocybe aegerita TaxID=1973307 RepID=A0A8S0W014_CYCAE|nr:unnamed protein product [Cyclocybe aegerita]
MAEAAFAATELLDVESLTTDLSSAVEQIFISAYFRKSLRFRTLIIKPCIVGERAALRDIVQRAWDLSLSMQKDLVSCQAKVTIAPKDPKTKDFRPFDSRCVDGVLKGMGTEDGDQVLGTFRFGFEQINEYGERKCFIRPEVITESLLHNSDQM